MMVNKWLMMAGTALLLSACQSLPPQDAVAAEATDQAGSGKGAEAVAASTTISSAVLPDVVYSVLAGDIATQRGRYLEAYKHYFYAAGLGRQAELAELATKSALAAQAQEEGREAVALWLELSPDHVGALQIGALLAIEENDMDLAASYLRRVISVSAARGEDGYLEVARLLTKIGDEPLRLQLMRRLVADAQDDPQALFALALVEMSSSNVVESEAVLRRALELRPDWHEARVLLVRALGTQEKDQEARQTLERFLGDYPDDTKLRAAYARLLLQQEDVDAAERQFQLLLKDDPENPDTLFALAILALHQEERDAAKEYFRRLHATGKHADEAAFYLGQLLEEDGQEAEALTWYQKVEGSDEGDARVRIARIHAKRGEVSRAREIIQQLRGEVVEDTVQLDLIEGEILSDVKQYQAAVDVLTRALQEHPGHPDLLYARGLTAVNLDRIDIMEQDLREILKQEPDHADALNALGYTLADRTDRYQEALGYIQKALVLKPESPAILDSMGWVQYRLGNQEEALRYLTQAMEQLPDPEIAAHLGEVLWHKGERERARKIWKEALANNPDNDYLLRVLKRFNQLPQQ